MTKENKLNFRIFVNQDEIYNGNLAEVPEEYRNRIANDLKEWGSTLGKRGLNELLYSHLAWYEKMGYYCLDCGVWLEDGGDDTEISCEECGGRVEHRYIYPRDEKLDKIITCAGLISEVRIEEI